MPSTTAWLVEECEPMEMPSNELPHDRNSRSYQHQVSDSVLEVAENGRSNSRPERPPPPSQLRVTTRPIVSTQGNLIRLSNPCNFALRFSPESWQRFECMIPPVKESSNDHLLLIQCYNKRKLKLNELYLYWIVLSVLNCFS